MVAFHGMDGLGIEGTCHTPKSMKHPPGGLCRDLDFGEFLRSRHARQAGHLQWMKIRIILSFMGYTPSQRIRSKGGFSLVLRACLGVSPGTP